MLVRAQKRNPELQVRLGADTWYQNEKLALRQRAISPHLSEHVKGNLARKILQEAEVAGPRRSISQQKRRLIEWAFGWSKLDRPAVKADFRPSVR